MPLLILDVANYCINLGPRIGKSTKAFLPGKSSANPSLLINQPRRVGFDILSQFRHGQIGGQSVFAMSPTTALLTELRNLFGSGCATNILPLTGLTALTPLAPLTRLGERRRPGHGIPVLQARRLTCGVALIA
jgi:hypothetical protein